MKTFFRSLSFEEKSFTQFGYQAETETKPNKNGLLGEYFKGPCFYSRGQFKATWNESDQNILGKAQSPAD